MKYDAHRRARAKQQRLHIKVFCKKKKTALHLFLSDFPMLYREAQEMCYKEAPIPIIKYPYNSPYIAIGIITHFCKIGIDKTLIYLYYIIKHKLNKDLHYGK
jgi:hypothetical protein